MDGDLELAFADHPVLSQLPAVERVGLLAQSVRHRVQAGTVLFDQGDRPAFQQFLLCGTVHLYGRSIDRREVLIEVVEAPELIIPAAVLVDRAYLMRARVVESNAVMVSRARTVSRA